MPGYSQYSGYGRPQFRFGPGRWGSAIKWLVVANVIVFLFQNFSPGLTQNLGLTPSEFFSDFPNRLYQPITYMFLHGGFWHILINMLFLWMFGTEIESMWGTARFLKFYFYCGLGGALLSLILNYNSLAVIIGASGAIFGVMIAYWKYFPDRYLYLYFFIPIKVKYAIPALLFVPMLITMFASTGDHVAHLAHLGGAMVGFVLTRRPNAFAGTGFPTGLKDWMRRRKHERMTTKLHDNRRQAEDVMRRVDAILDKINEVGIENLTAEERKFLEEASQRLSRDKRQT